MASLSTSCFGLLQLSSSTFKKLSTETIKFSIFSTDHGYQITDSNDLYKVSVLSLEKVFLSTSVLQVSCNDSVLAFVTNAGFLLVMGEDKEKTGILGLKGVYSIKTPAKVHINTRVGSVQLGAHHAAMLSSKGELYTWGTGKCGELGMAYGERQLPCLVQTAKIFLIRQVVCGTFFTAFCTAGGFVYIYGKLPKGDCEVVKARQPFTVRGMCDHFIEELFCNQYFLVAVTDKREAYVVDACMNLKKLPQEFLKLACSNTSIIGIGKLDRVIHEFTPDTSSDCRANSLTESAYFIDEILINEFEIFSGHHVSCAIYSKEELIYEINLQLLSLQKVFFDSTEEKTEEPDQRIRKTLLRMFTILNTQLKNNKKNSIYAIKLLAMCRKVALQKPIILILTPILTSLMKKALIKKRAAWKKFKDFVEKSKKNYELNVIRKGLVLQNCLIKIGKKVFLETIDYFEMSEFIRKYKAHVAERIFLFLGRKRVDMRRQGLYAVKCFTQSVEKIQKKLIRVVELTEKSIKLKFVQYLVNNHIVKLKIYKTITQIVAYSNAQNSRVRVLKFFHLWKRNVVAIKISQISQKYARSIRTKKMAENLTQLIRKVYKLGWTSIKAKSHPHFNRFKVIFLNNSLHFAFQSTMRPIFQTIKTNKIYLRSLKLACQSLLRPRFQQFIYCLKLYINRRKMIVLLKLLMKLNTKAENFNHRSLFRGFSRLFGYNPRALSPALSLLSSDSQPHSPQPKTSLPSRLPISKPRHKLLTKEHTKSTASLIPPERFSSKKNVSISKAPKNLTPSKFKQRKLINKKKKESLLQRPRIYVETEESLSIYSSPFDLSPKNQTFLTEDSPEKRPSWEEQMLLLAVAMVSSLLKGHLKGFFKEIVG